MKGNHIKTIKVKMQLIKQGLEEREADREINFQRVLNRSIPNDRE